MINNQIPLVLKNNLDVSVPVSLFTGPSNLSQLSNTRKQYNYDLTPGVWGLDQLVVIIQYRPINTTQPFSVLNIQFPGTGFPTTFDIVFNAIREYFIQNNIGLVFGNEPDLLLVSNLYEFGTLTLPEA